MSRPLIALRRPAGFTALLLIALTILDYVLGVNSEAMQYATTAVMKSENLEQSIGEVSSVRLRKLWGYSQRTGYGNSAARLSIVAIGSREERGITLWLQQVNGEWTLARSSEPL